MSVAHGKSDERFRGFSYTEGGEVGSLARKGSSCRLQGARFESGNERAPTTDPGAAELRGERGFYWGEKVEANGQLGNDHRDPEWRGGAISPGRGARKKGQCVAALSNAGSRSPSDGDLGLCRGLSELEATPKTPAELS